MSTNPYYEVYEYSTNTYPDLATSDVSGSYWPTIYLYEEGCWVNGVRNCTAMCMDSDLIWDSPSDKVNLNVSANIGNCAVYAILANLLEYENGNISNADLASEYGILSANQVDLDAINGTAGLCLQSYCAAQPTKCASSRSSYRPWKTFEYDFGNLTVPSYEGMCLYVEGRLNPDIAGIGVLTAYMMAAVILLAVYIGLRLSRTFAKYITWPYFMFSEGGFGHNWLHAAEKSSDLQKSIASSHNVAILISSLADFQKGQCVFWLSIDAAVLIGVAGSAQTLGVASLASFTINLRALQAVCICGFLFTAFGLYCLHLFSKRSWYIFCLSFATAVFSAVAWGVTFFANPDNLAPNRDVQFQGCGPFDPTAYCEGVYGIYSLNWLSHSQVDSVSVGFGGMCMLVLFGDMILHNTRYRDSRLARHICTCEREIPKWRVVLISAVEFLVEAAFVTLWAFLFAYLVTLARSSDVNAWGFGQIIAMTIWIPVLLEWFYATTRGLENASEYRITLPYKLIRTDSIKRRRDSTPQYKPQYNKVGARDDEENNENGMDFDNIDYRPVHREHRIPRKPVPSRSVPAKTAVVSFKEDERLPLQEQDLPGSSSSFFPDR